MNETFLRWSIQWMTKTDKVLQLSRAFMQKYGFKFLTRGAIAAWGEAIDGKAMSNENIRLIEERALRKLRRYGVFKQEDLNHLCHIASRHYRREH